MFFVEKFEKKYLKIITKYNVPAPYLVSWCSMWSGLIHLWIWTNPLSEKGVLEKINKTSGKKCSDKVLKPNHQSMFILMRWLAVKHHITKTCLYNFDPLKPHFYIVKLGFTGVYIIFLISAQNIDCGYSLEPPHQGGSNEYPQSMFCAEIWKISDIFTWKFSFFGGKISNIVE